VKFEIYRRGLLKKQWHWRLVARNGRSIAISGEGYHNKADLLQAMHLVGTVDQNTPVSEVKE
jgi:uncharacterized protein YegP (UPF0339 family)